jgi:hypothetical protein
MIVAAVLYLLVGLVLACIVVGFGRAGPFSGLQIASAALVAVVAWPAFVVIVIARVLAQLGANLAEEDEA